MQNLPVTPLLPFVSRKRPLQRTITARRKQWNLLAACWRASKLIQELAQDSKKPDSKIVSILLCQ